MPHEHDPPEPELTAIEAALGGLVPARSRVDRDLIMYRAGRASARPARVVGERAWAAAAAILAAVAAGEAGLLARRPAPGVVERVVVVLREPAGPRVTPTAARRADPSPLEPRPPGLDFGLGQTARGRLVGQVLRYGLDGLPAPPLAARAGPEPWPDSSFRFRQEELRKLLEPGDPS